jgi:hypothetical protein
MAMMNQLLPGLINFSLQQVEVRIERLYRLRLSIGPSGIAIPFCRIAFPLGANITTNPIDSNVQINKMLNSFAAF